MTDKHIRPPLWPGIPVWNKNSGEWIVLGCDASLYDSDNLAEAILLAGEPGCPSLPKEFQHVCNYEERWGWRGSSIKPCGLWVPEGTVTHIPSHVLPEILQWALNNNQMAGYDAEAAKKVLKISLPSRDEMYEKVMDRSQELKEQGDPTDISDELLKRRPPPFEGMPVWLAYLVGEGKWCRIKERFGGWVLKSDYGDGWNFNYGEWREGGFAKSIRLPGEPGCPELPEDMRPDPNKYALWLIREYNKWVLSIYFDSNTRPHKQGITVPEGDLERLREWCLNGQYGSDPCPRTTYPHTTYDSCIAAKVPSTLRPAGDGSILPTYKPTDDKPTFYKPRKCPRCGLTGCMCERAGASTLLRDESKLELVRRIDPIKDAMKRCKGDAEAIRLLQCALDHVRRRCEVER